MKSYTIIDFIKALYHANKGRLIWRLYNKKYNIQLENHYFVLLPSNNVEYNACFLKYIDTCMEPRKKIVILSVDKTVEKAAAYYKNKNELFIEQIDSEMAYNLIRYYAVSHFYHRFLLISLDEPYERSCSSLIGKKGITVDELIAVGIMGCDRKKFIHKKNKLDDIVYNGKDEDLIKFFNVNKS